MSILHINLLGDFLLTSDNTPITTITILRVQSLLAYLLLHRAAPQNRSHLAFLLWPDSTEAQAHTNLRQLLHHLRQSLPDAEHFLSISKHSVQWLPLREDYTFTLDVLEFEEALAQAKRAEDVQDMNTARQALERGLALYRGELLPNCYEEWILPERDRLRLLFVQVAGCLITLQEQERDYSTAIATAHKLLHHDPLQETTYRQLMHLYMLQENRATALRTYHTCVTTLERELGVEPDKVTQATYETIVQSHTLSETAARPPVYRDSNVLLVGRKTEWQQLQQVWRNVVDGQLHIVMLTGEGGIGKTRLAEEMMTWVSRSGMATASTRCYSELARLAYSPVTMLLQADAIQANISTLEPPILTEIARLLPELFVTHPTLSPPSAMTEGWQRQHFFEALTHIIRSISQPLLLLFDDLQWCDHETLQWLQYFVQSNHKSRMLLIGAIRAEEITPSHPLLPFLGAAQRNGIVTEMALDPLNESETTTLAEHVTGQQLDQVMSNVLYCETEGNPLFVVEMARANTLGQFAQPSTDTKASQSLLTRHASTLPPAIQSVLAARLALLSPLAREVVEVAAVIGREFAFSLLAQASGQIEDVLVRGLDELWQRRIVREQGTGIAETYDFTHDKLREQVYISLSPAQRRRLHRRIAMAFEELYASHLDAVSGQIASHFERAGLAKQAILSYQRAGRVAMNIYAHAEALSMFERAIALLEKGLSLEHIAEEQVKEITAQIYESQGDIAIITGHLHEARHIFQRIQSMLPQQEAIWQARLQRKIANTWNHTSANPHDTTPQNARQAFLEAESLLAQAEDSTSPAWYYEWIELQFAQIWPLRGSEADMATVIEKIRPVIEQHGTREQRELFMSAVAMHSLIRARYVVSAQHIAFFRKTVTEMQKTGNKSKLAILHFSFGVTLLWSGFPDEAEEQIGKALDIAEQIDLAWLQIRCLTFLPFIFRKRGQVEQVRSVLALAQAKSEGRKNSLLMGHHAWIAWREGNFSAAESYGRAVLEEGDQEQQDINMYRWVGIWPLLAVAFAHEQFTEVMSYIRMLLNPMQQLPPQQLKEVLESALHAWETGQQQEACMSLQQGILIAQQLGYL